VLDAAPETIDAAIDAALRAVEQLASLTLWERAELLSRTADELEADAEAALAEHVLEHGKTIAEATAEIAAAAGGLRSTAEYARRMDGRITSAADRSKRVLTERRPLGLVGAITPWNVPFMVPIEYGAPALAMGNAFICKPAESVPQTSRHIAAAFAAAGWPDGSFQLLVGGPATGAAFARRQELDALCFTGSSEVGVQIASIGGMRKQILELGGNGPTIVFADADLEQAADRIVAGACFLSGQSCAATERVLVERSAESDLLEALVDRTEGEIVGDPRLPETTLGPIHLADTAQKIERHVREAADGGARVLSGGQALADAPTDRYWQPTVLADVVPEMEVFREETFGPVMPITPFGAEREALELAAVGNYGLSAAVFTRDLDRAFAVANALPASYVVVNDTSNYWEMHLPWGGGRGTRSGVGRLGGDHALMELSTTKSVVLNLRRV
jgi:acyl-CoA reductase-like NAD-dependent aldehyde dehydrogenase